MALGSGLCSFVKGECRWGQGRATGCVCLGGMQVEAAAGSGVLGVVVCSAGAACFLLGRFTASLCISFPNAQPHFPLLALPARRDRKMMSALCASGAGAGRRVLFVKGAPESVLERCTGALTNQGSGAVEAMTPGLRSALHAKVGQAAVVWQWGSAGAAGRGGSGAISRPQAPEGCSLTRKATLTYVLDLMLTPPCPACLLACLPPPQPPSQPPTEQVAEYGSGSALRVLALAYRPWPASDRSDVRPEDEQALTFIGLVGMQVRHLNPPPLADAFQPLSAPAAAVSVSPGCEGR